MIPLTDAQLRNLAPNIRAAYAQAFATADAQLARHEINATPRRLRHFMAQILHESGGLTVLWENMNYSAPRLPEVWPSRFQPRGPLDPAAYAHNPQTLGDEVYGGRMGNGPGEGFLYRGRGLIQTTGKDSYAQARAVLQAEEGAEAPDLVADPDLILDPRWCLRVAAAEYAGLGCNAMADQDSGGAETTALVLRRITRAINGGLIGLSERAEWLRRTSRTWPD